MQHGFPTDKIFDPFIVRQCMLDKRHIKISVEATLPIMITLDEYITSNIIKTNSKLTNVTCNLVDNAMVNRFTFLGAVQSPLTNNIIYFFYDKQEQDIFITPNLAFTKLSNETAGFTFSAYRLGSGERLGNYNLNSVIAPSRKEARYYISEPKDKVPLKAHLVTLTGASKESLFGQKDNQYEEMITDKINIYHAYSTIAVIVELGTISDLLKTVGELPVYLLFQQSIKQFGIDYIGPKNTGNNKLYVLLHF